MAKTTITTTTNTCDICKEPIVGGYYVDAMAYGATAHPHCWRDNGGVVIARLLGLDDIVTRWVLDDGPTANGRYGGGA